MADDTTDKSTEATSTGTTDTDTDAPAPRRRRFPFGGGSSKEGAAPADRPRGGGPSFDVNKARTLLARVLWAVCALFALVLAGAALLIALSANPDNELVRWVI